MSIIQSGSSWKFYQYAIVPKHGKDANFQKSIDEKGEAVFTFKFLYSGRQVEVILKEAATEQLLRGKYTRDSPSKEKRIWSPIEFEVSEEGTLLKGIPEGMQGVRTWFLTSNHENKDEPISNRS